MQVISLVGRRILDCDAFPRSPYVLGTVHQAYMRQVSFQCAHLPSELEPKVAAKGIRAWQARPAS